MAKITRGSWLLIALPLAWVGAAGGAPNFIEIDCFPKSVSVLTNAVEVKCHRTSDGTEPKKVSVFRMSNGNSTVSAFFELAETARVSGAILRLGYPFNGSANDSTCSVNNCRTPSTFGLVAETQNLCLDFNSFDSRQRRSDFCTNPGCPCHMLEGDCDGIGTSDQCANGLICRENVGLAVHQEDDIDLCYPASCPTFNAASPSPSFCTTTCPCYIGEGNCTNDDQCMGGLICVPNSGASYGLPASYGVCKACPAFDPANRDSEFCSARCPCGHGEGDCDVDGPPECLPNTVCVMDIGANFGLPNTWDVCVAKWSSFAP